MKKIGILVAALILIMLMPAAAHAAFEPVSSSGGTVTDAQSFIEALGGEEAAYIRDDAITLLSDISLKGSVDIVSGSYTINGTGCYIYRADDYKGTLITIGKDASLTLGNSRGNDAHPSLTIDGQGVKANSAMLTVSGKLDVYPGTAFLDAAGSESCCGGAVFIDSGSAVFRAGTITDCTAGDGGAIFVNGGELTAALNITGCSAGSGGALFCSGPSNTAFIGKITECSASKRGGAVYIGEGSTFTTDSTEFSYCKAEEGGGFYTNGNLISASAAVGVTYCDAELGGAIYADSSAQTELKGISVSMNTARRAAGIYNAGKLVTYEGAEFIYNEAAIEAGAMINYGNVTMFGGSFSSNDCEGHIGGIINYGVFNMSEGSVSSNKSDNDNIGIDNHGSIKLSDHCFISFNNPVLLRRYTTDDGSQVLGDVYIVGELTANTPIATFRPVEGQGYDYVDVYIPGDLLVNINDSGNNGVPSEEKIAVSDYNGRVWSIKADGTLKRGGWSDSIDLPLPILIAISASALIAVLAILWAVTVRKKKLKAVSSESAPENDNDNNKDKEK